MLGEDPFKGQRSKKTEYEKRQLIDKGIDNFSIRLNLEERQMLENAKRMLAVDRDSTAIKELAYIGFNVIHGFKMDVIISKILGRLRRGYADTISYYNEKKE